MDKKLNHLYSTHRVCFFVRDSGELLLQCYCSIIIVTLIDLILGLVFRAKISAPRAWLSCSLYIVLL